MQNSITWVGMDVHAENIVLAALRDSSDAVLFRAEFPNTPKGRERLAGRLAENAPVSKGTDGLYRSGTQRALERRERTTRKHHEDRERSHPASPDRIGVALPAAPRGNAQDHPRPARGTTPRGD